MNIDGLDTLREIDGLTIGTFPDDIWDAIATASKEVMEEVANTNEFVAKLSDAYFTYVGRASSYKELFDDALLQQRRRFVG